MLERVRPELVLVEGPEDATPLIDAIVDRETTPPIAILGYRTDGTPASSLWPFASYSPEYVALRWANSAGVRSEFIDLTTGQALAREKMPAPEEPADEPEEHTEHAEDASPPDSEPRLRERLASLRGFRSFEEFWEASFEAPAYDEAS